MSTSPSVATSCAADGATRLPLMRSTSSSRNFVFTCHVGTATSSRLSSGCHHDVEHNLGGPIRLALRERLHALHKRSVLLRRVDELHRLDGRATIARYELTVHCAARRTREVGRRIN